MLLAIDVGNTNTVLGLFRLGNEAAASELVANWRITTPSKQTSDEFGVLLLNLFHLKNLEMGSVSEIAISSVVPPLDSMLRQACELYFKRKPLFIELGVKTGMPVLTDNPSEVGADRIVNCVAAFEQFGGPCIVVDMGTVSGRRNCSRAWRFGRCPVLPCCAVTTDRRKETYKGDWHRDGR